MAHTVTRVEYYRTDIEDRPGQAYELLSHLANKKVNLLAVSAFPVGPAHTQFTLFPESSSTLIDAAQSLGLTLTGPTPAILIRGDDQLGALVVSHRKLADAGVSVFATNGVSDGGGRYGYVIHVRPDDFDAACNALDAA
jgi:hypothetical protein